MALRQPGDSDYAARVRLELTRKQAALRDCLPQVPKLAGAKEGTRSEPLYVSPGIRYFPKRSVEALLRAFEQCVAGLLDSWPPPLPVTTYEGVWVRSHFARGDGAALPSESPAQPCQERAGMTRPVRLSGPTLQCSRPAIEHGVRGLMRVKCIITAEGVLETCRILRAQPFTEAAVLNALTQSRYTPVTFQGEPRSVDYTFTLELAPPKQ